MKSSSAHGPFHCPKRRPLHLHVRWLAVVLVVALLPRAQAGPNGDPVGAYVPDPPTFTNITTTGAVMHWSVVDDCGPSQVAYRPATGAQEWTTAAQNATANGQHTMTFSGLLPHTRYNVTLDVPAWCGIGGDSRYDAGFETSPVKTASTAYVGPLVAILLAVALLRRTART